MKPEGAALGALLPTGIDGLVATYVDILGGEEFDGLLENVAEELHGLGIARAEEVAADEMLLGHLVLHACARQPRVSHDGRKDMSGELNLGNHLHAAHRGIGHYLADVVLCVEAARTLLVAAGPGTDLCQARVLLAL